MSHRGYPFIPRAPTFSPGGTPARCTCIYKRMREPGRFRDPTLVRIRRPDRSGGAALPVAHEILSEAGWDMSKWETEDHFVSWLRLCPDNRISGDKIIGKGRLPTNNRVSIALKMVANALRTSKTLFCPAFVIYCGIYAGRLSYSITRNYSFRFHARFRQTGEQPTQTRVLPRLPAMSHSPA